MPWRRPSISLPCSFDFSAQPKSLQAAVERLPVVAGVGLAALVERLHVRKLPRHLVLGDEIAPAEFDAVDAEIVRRHVEQPLAEEIRLEAARPAIGAGRRLVGEQQRHLEMDVRHAIGPGQHLRGVARRGDAVGADVGAEIGARPRRAGPGWCRRARRRSPARIRRRGRGSRRSGSRGGPRPISPARSSFRAANGIRKSSG